MGLQWSPTVKLCCSLLCIEHVGGTHNTLIEFMFTDDSERSLLQLIASRTQRACILFKDSLDIIWSTLPRILL